MVNTPNPQINFSHVGPWFQMFLTPGKKSLLLFGNKLNQLYEDLDTLLSCFILLWQCGVTPSDTNCQLCRVVLDMCLSFWSVSFKCRSNPCLSGTLVYKLKARVKFTCQLSLCSVSVTHTPLFGNLASRVKKDENHEIPPYSYTGPEQFARVNLVSFGKAKNGG